MHSWSSTIAHENSKTHLCLLLAGGWCRHRAKTLSHRVGVRMRNNSCPEHEPRPTPQKEQKRKEQERDVE